MCTTKPRQHKSSYESGMKRAASSSHSLLRHVPVNSTAPTAIGDLATSMVDLASHWIVDLGPSVRPVNAGAYAIRPHNAALQGRGLVRGTTPGHRHHKLLRSAACTRKLCRGLAGRASSEAAAVLDLGIAATVICA